MPSISLNHFWTMHSQVWLAADRFTYLEKQKKIYQMNGKDKKKFNFMSDEWCYDIWKLKSKKKANFCFFFWKIK